MRLWLLLLGCGGCAGTHAVRGGVVWSAGEAEPEAPPPARAASQEPYVPHLRCNDATLAPDCAANALHGDCCVNQGGVYRDAWGNLVFE